MTMVRKSTEPSSLPASSLKLPLADLEAIKPRRQFVGGVALRGIGGADSVISGTQLNAGSIAGGNCGLRAIQYVNCGAMPGGPITTKGTLE